MGDNRFLDDGDPNEPSTFVGTDIPAAPDISDKTSIARSPGPPAKPPPPPPPARSSTKSVPAARLSPPIAEEPPAARSASEGSGPDLGRLPTSLVDLGKLAPGARSSTDRLPLDSTTEDLRPGAAAPRAPREAPTLRARSTEARLGDEDGSTLATSAKTGDPIAKELEKRTATGSVRRATGAIPVAKPDAGPSPVRRTTGAIPVAKPDAGPSPVRRTTGAIPVAKPEAGPSPVRRVTGAIPVAKPGPDPAASPVRRSTGPIAVGTGKPVADSPAPVRRTTGALPVAEQHTNIKSVQEIEREREEKLRAAAERKPSRVDVASQHTNIKSAEQIAREAGKLATDVREVPAPGDGARQATANLDLNQMTLQPLGDTLEDEEITGKAFSPGGGRKQQQARSPLGLVIIATLVVGAVGFAAYQQGQTPSRFELEVLYTQTFRGQPVEPPPEVVEFALVRKGRCAAHPDDTCFLYTATYRSTQVEVVGFNGPDGWKLEERGLGASN